MLTVVDVSDDVWFLIFGLLTPLDFLCVHQTCLFLRDITNGTKHHEINNYWQHQCKKLWSQIEKTKYKTKNWYSLFESIIDVIVNTKYVYRLLRTHKENPGIVEQIRSISTTNQIKFKPNIAIKDLDSILFASYNFLLTMDMISQNEQSLNFLKGSSISNGILKADSIELFKIYTWNMSDNEIHSININTSEENDNYNMQNQQNMSLLRESIRCNSYQIIKYILTEKKFENIDVGDIDCEQFPVKRWRYVRLGLESKHTPLMLAARLKQINTVSLLLKHPKMTLLGINARSYYGQTALHYAMTSHRMGAIDESINDGVEIIKLIVNDKRTDVNLKSYNINVTTPLFTAVSMLGHSKFVEALLSNKYCFVDVDLKDYHKNTVLHYIAGGKMRPISVRDQQIISAKMLLTRTDLDRNILNRDGKTALQIATETNYEAMVNILSE